MRRALKPIVNKAVIGTVRNQEISILMKVLQLTPLTPYLAKPTPRTAETDA